MKYNINKWFRMLPVAAIALSLAACGADDIDNAASRNLSVIQITPSADYIKLDETKPDEVAQIGRASCRERV